MNTRKIILAVFFLAVCGIVYSVVQYTIETNSKKTAMQRQVIAPAINTESMPEEIPQAMKEAMSKMGASGQSAEMGNSSTMSAMNMSKLFSDPNVSQELSQRAGELMMKMKEDPQNVETLLDLAMLFYDAKDPIGTLNFASRASVIDPLNADASYLSGLAHAQLQEADKAIEAFDRSLLSKNSAQTRYNKALVYIHALSDKANGKAELEKALALPDVTDELKKAIDKELSGL